MNKFITTILLSCICMLAFAQEKELINVLFDESRSETKYQKGMKEKILARLNSSGRQDFQYYTYDESSEEVYFQETGEERFSTKLLFIRLKIEVDYQPKITLTYDGEKNINGAFMHPEYDAIGDYKLIDLSSSEVLSAGEYAYNLRSRTTKVSSPLGAMKIDYKKYYNKKSEKKSSSGMTAAERIHRAYKGELTKRYDEAQATKEFLSGYIAGQMSARKDEKMFEISPVTNKKGMSSFMINAGKNTEVEFLDNVTVVKKTSYGGSSYAETIGLAVVRKSDATEAKCKFILTGGKKLKTAVEAGEEVYATRSRRLINSLNDRKLEQVRVGMDKDCMFCNAKVENMLANIENIVLVENSHQYAVQYFASKFSAEMAAVNIKKDAYKDVSYTINETDDNSISAIVQSTGEEVINEKGLTSADYRQFFVELFGNEMEIVEVTKQKKEKIKKAVIYSPYGFERLEILNVVVITEEEINGKMVKSKEEIGRARVMNRLSDTLAEVSITKGEKALGEAIANGATIGFGYYQFGKK